MGKKVREYKSGDFIFAKVKGYPAWPARVQRLNGKKYFVYFYGTGETANLPPNMIFDYAENKDKFLTKTVKRRDFNNGVKQIEHDFANNVPLEQVIGMPIEETAESLANDTANESGANDTLDETATDTTAVDDTIADDTINQTTNDTVEDSDDIGSLVIDEGKQKGRKSKAEAKAKETPVKPMKEPKTPRGKAKKEEPTKEDDEEDKKEEEIVSRSGRKIRPKRYIDEQTEDNATLPSPAPKKRRGASPTPALDKEKEKSNEPKEKISDKNIKHFNAISQSELEDLKEPFKPDLKFNDDVNLANISPKVDTVKIIPTFGRKKNTSKKLNKIQESKSKKFVPPTKILQNVHSTANSSNQIQEGPSISTLTSISSNHFTQASVTLNTTQVHQNTYCSMTNVQKNLHKIVPIQSDHGMVSEIDVISNEMIRNTNCNDTDFQENIQITSEYERKVVAKKTMSNTLGNIISNSLFMLNNDDVTPIEHFSQESDHSSVNLSQSMNQSFCSVTSLTKTYKNLDCNSFKGNPEQIVANNDNVENESHKIPYGDDYLNLFMIPYEKFKPVAMSTEFGDVGFNSKYSAYIKSKGKLEDVTDEEKVIREKILQMYPKENRLLIKSRKSK